MTVFSVLCKCLCAQKKKEEKELCKLQIEMNERCKHEIKSKLLFVCYHFRTISLNQISRFLPQS